MSKTVGVSNNEESVGVSNNENSVGVSNNEDSVGVSNNEDSDQTPQNAASDQNLHCLTLQQSILFVDDCLSEAIEFNDTESRCTGFLCFLY